MRQSVRAEAMAAIGDGYMVNSNGPKTEPRGTPVVTGVGVDLWLLT